MLIYGLENGLIELYNDELIYKLRDIYYSFLPASIILLSNALSNGRCYDSALLMSQAFLDDEGDVKLVYASIESLRLNPKYISDNELDSDHCFVEYTDINGKSYIYDASEGLVYDKNLYWKIEKPIVRKVNDKNSIINYLNDDFMCGVKLDKRMANMCLSFIENTYNNKREIYTIGDNNLLKREIEHYKSRINLNDSKVLTKRI